MNRPAMHTSPSDMPRLAGLPTALGLSLLFLLFTALRLFGEYSGTFTTQVGQSVAREFLDVESLRDDLALFVAAQIGLHLCFGLLNWGCAVLVQRAGLGLRLPRWQLVCALSLVAFTWVGVANATLFPWSLSGGWFRHLTHEALGVSTLEFLTVAICTAGAAVAILAVRRTKHSRRLARAGIWTLVIGFSAAVLLALPETSAHRQAVPGRKPNVIVIGIDSLRADMLGINDGSWLTPALDQYLREAIVVKDTTSPLARTFPAWVSILTGRHPQSTGARENLVPKRRLHLDDTLATLFKAGGYATAYATDEARFNNIDASYGFDTAITPTLGAADFMLGSINDLPLANLIANTWISELLFPATYANRGAAATYKPETFVRQVLSEVDFSQPTFLAVHLTLPHWPFHWAEDTAALFADTTSQPYAYLASVAGADRQFAMLMRGLANAGALDNALVVVLSDHGEGLGLPHDNMIPSKEAKLAAERTTVWMWGHGTSVLSPPQYSVLLSFRGFGPTTLPSASSARFVPATLEDIAPTLVDFLKLPRPATEFEGRSLAAFLQDSRLRPDADDERVRFTETAFNTPSLRRGLMDQDELLTEGSYAFGVNKATGRVELREERWAELLGRKERAAIQGNWLLAAIPTERDDVHRYLLVDRKLGMPRKLRDIPDASVDPVGRRLWDALHARYPGELGQPER